MQGQGTFAISISPGNYQNRQTISDIIGCEFTRAKTGWPEDVVSGYSAPRGAFIIYTIRFDPSDVDELYPLPGTELIRINNSNPARNIAYQLMGFDPAGPGLTYLQEHVSDEHDILYKRQFLYVRSAELGLDMLNDPRLEVDSTATPPGSTDRCIFRIPIDQDATTGRVIRRFLGSEQSFYTDVLGGPAYKDFTNVTLTITDSAGNIIDFRNAYGNQKYSRWSITLRFDDVSPVAVPP